jgi:hypothetical protein
MMPRNHPVQDQLELRATQLRGAAEILPDGEERKGLMFRACGMEDASIIINKWPRDGTPTTPLFAILFAMWN